MERKPEINCNELKSLAESFPSGITLSQLELDDPEVMARLFPQVESLLRAATKPYPGTIHKSGKLTQMEDKIRSLFGDETLKDLYEENC